MPYVLEQKIDIRYNVKDDVYDVIDSQYTGRTLSGTDILEIMPQILLASLEHGYET